MREPELIEKTAAETASTILLSTNQPSFPTRVVCFGPFYLDVSRNQLYLNQSRIKLFGKPIKLLKRLLEKPNEIVLREQLSRHLWANPSDINIDTNLCTTLNKLRRGLGDSAFQPTYIETVHGIGYRFIAPVQYSESPPPPFEANRSAFSLKPREIRGLHRIFSRLQRRKLALSNALTVFCTAIFVGIGCSFVWVAGIGAKSLRALVLIIMIAAATAAMVLAAGRLMRDLASLPK